MVIISMMVLWDANANTEQDKRRSGLSSDPLDMEHDNNKTKQSTAIALNIQHIHHITYLVIKFSM